MHAAHPVSLSFPLAHSGFIDLILSVLHLSSFLVRAELRFVVLKQQGLAISEQRQCSTSEVWVEIIPSQAQLHSQLLYRLPKSSTGGWGMGRFITHCLCCSSSSHASPGWDPTYRRQSFMNVSIVGPFHGVQTIKNRLLQRGCPMGPQVLPQKPAPA